jgi:serine protease Do
MNRVRFGSISLGSDLAEVATRLRAATAGILGLGGNCMGSGVLWRVGESGALVVTNAHVTNACGGRYVVQLPSSLVLEAGLLARDARFDVAVLQIPALQQISRKEERLRAVELGDASLLRTGEVVIAVGNPMGVTGALAIGTVHAATHGPWIRADIRLEPGNSGGPLADARGRVIGINSMIVDGFGVAVTSNTVEAFLASAVEPARGHGARVVAV